jgi:hypothetical protein
MADGYTDFMQGAAAQDGQPVREWVDAGVRTSALAD